MNYKLTIIMSNYNQAHFIKGAIDSVLMQETNFPFQLIITDDNSTKDNSIEIVKEYENKYPDKIKVLYNKENGRYLKNILRAKAITKTPYFTLLDADDYWTDKHYLQKSVDFLDGHPDFTIYSTNVLSLYEDGSTRPYLDTDKKTFNFSMEDFLHESILITQTTGMVFRNVIYSKGIPDIVTNSIGTISERSFEGDYDRFIMHLRYGKAHFVNEISGVYRILSFGIWQSLNPFEKAAIQAQSFIDYDRFFEEQYHNFFINKAWREIKICLKYLRLIRKKEKTIFRKEAQDKFFYCLSVCMQNKKILNSYVQRKIEKFKNKIYRIKHKL